MNNKLFFSVFLITLTLLTFFLGSSITGLVVQSSYCDNSGCYEFCKSDSDCINMICCQEQNFGICKGGCDQKYVFQPEIDVEYNPSTLEQPQQIQRNPWIYISLIFLTLLIGVLYLLGGKKVHLKVK